MKTQEQQTEIIIEVAGLLAKGYETEIESVIKAIKKREDAPMQEDLKKKYDKVKSTPIEEPALYDLIEKINKQEASIIDIVLEFLSEEELDKYSSVDVAYFAGQVKRKIESLKDENGIFKSTPNTSMWQPPKPSVMKKVENILRDKTLSSDDIEQKATDLLVETSGVDKDVLTEWELRLVVGQSKEAFSGFRNSFLGKR